MQKRLAVMASIEEQKHIEASSIGSEILCEFLEVAFHSILYLRGLYPANVFEKRKKYNVPVQMCLHPDVSQYIAQVIESIHRIKKDSSIGKVLFVVLGSDHCPLERFVFETTETQSYRGDDAYLFRLEQCLREFILKLNTTDAVLKPLPNDCTWTVQVETTDSAAAGIHDKQMVQGFPWVEADERETTLKDVNIVPLKAVASDYMKMQLFVEESDQKR